MAENKTIKDIIDKVKKNKRWPDTKLIQRAYNYALEKHGEQKRKSGEPYIIHPLAVAKILAEMGMDAESVCAALLHDTVEDCSDKTNLKDIEKKEEIDEMRKEFLSNVSHELKTPIALIQGYAEGLKEGINDDEEHVLKLKEFSKNGYKFEIVTDVPDQISEELLATLHHGVTEIRVEGMYSHTDK